MRGRAGGTPAAATCELFAFCGAHPASLRYSVREFAAHRDAQGLRIGPSRHGGAQALVASVPLTADAAWRPPVAGELLVLRAGRA